jgi:WD40 repeat protein
MPDRPPPTSTEHELPFERLSPRDFERLCLALVTEEGYASVRHPGASGTDRGIDLAARRDGREIAFQCKRVRTFGPVEALAAVEKVLSLRGTELPSELIFLVTCDVSDEARRRASSRGGCMAVDVWGLTELDHRVRRHPGIVAQFFGLSPAVFVPTTSGVVTSPPKLPPYYQERNTYLAQLERMLLVPTRTRLAITGTGAVGVQGMGGIGKSVLAAAAAQKLAPQFPDGVFWIRLGRDADSLVQLRELATVVGATGADLFSVSQARDRVRKHLAGRRVLLVLDDVWTLEDAEALDVVDSQGRQLLTTRNAHLLASLGAQEICLDVLEPAEARELLAAWSGQEAAARSVAGEVAEECGRLPLALAVAGALARKLGGWDDVLDRLRKADLERLAVSLPNYLYPNVLRALEASVESLDAASRDRYLELAVFPDGAAVPEAAIATLWAAAGLGPEQVRELIGRLVELSLARRAVAGHLTLHDLQWDYLRRRAGDVLPLHRRIVDAYAARCPAGFANGPDDGWFFQRLPWHLAEAGEKEALRDLLLSFAWLRAKLITAGIHALGGDYDLLPGDRAAGQIQAALRLSAHVAARDPDQLAGQLLGRLREEDAPGLDLLLGEVRAWRGAPWLRPMSQALLPPGPLLRTLVTGKNLAALVALDEHRLVAATETCLEVWDVQTSELLRTRPFPAASLAVLNSRTVAVRAMDGPIYQWKVEEDSWSLLWPSTTGIRSALAALRPGHLLARWRRRFFRLRDPVLYTHSFDLPKPMAVLPGGRMVIVLADASLEIVDIASGRKLYGLPGPLTPSTSVAGLDDRHLAWARLPNTVEVCDLETGEIVGSLRTPEIMVPVAPTIAVPPGGSTLAVTTGMIELYVWDWRNGGFPFEAPGFISTMAWLDDRLLATLSSEGALQLWDTGTGEIVRIPHAQPGRSAHLLRAGERLLISASGEGSVRAWDLTQLMERRPSLLAGAWVIDIVFFDDQRAASSANDGTVRIWDVPSRTVLDTFTCELEKYGTPKLCVLGPDRLGLLLGRTLRIRTPEGSQDHPLDLEDPVRFLVASSTGHVAVAALRTLLILDPASGSTEKHETQGKSMTDGVLEDVKSVGSRLIWTRHGRASLFYRDLEAASFEEVPLGMCVDEVAPLPDGEVATVVRGGESPDILAIVDLRAGTVLRQWNGDADFILQLVPAGPDRFASIATDSTLRVWNARAGKPLATFTLDIEPSALAVSPGGKTLLVGDKNGGIHFLDLVEPAS